MDRRKSLKVLTLGAVSGSLVLDACKQADVKDSGAKAPEAAGLNYDRTPEEKAQYEKLMAQQFFTADEMAVIKVLSDIIIPADEVSGSATQAGVHDFIEFIVKDKPEFQTPMRGGLRWLNMHSIKLYEKSFADCSNEQRIAIVDAIAYPAKAKPEVKQGVSFFSLMRNLTATGFYSSKMGIADIGYVGNAPTKWDGVPEDVLKQYGLSYSAKELAECVKFT